MDDALNVLLPIKPNQGWTRWVRTRNSSNEKSKACNPGARIALALVLLLGGCAAQGPREPEPPEPKVLEMLDKERRFVAVPTGNHPCDVPNIYYEDDARGLRQLVVDWRALGDRSTYTLSTEGREALVERIKDSGQGCPTPYRIESRKVGLGDVRERQSGFLDYGPDKTKFRYEFSFVLYWLDHGQIRIKLIEYHFDPEPALGYGMPHRARFNFSRWDDLETNWGYKPYNGPVALPQVAYRIDEQRYFEVVPQEYFACARARLYYVDKGRGIRSLVTGWDNLRSGDFIIDAASKQYLVGPIKSSSSDCQSGSGSSFMCADRLPYSKDSGRTWEMNIPNRSGRDVYLSGDQVFAGGMASVKDLRPGYVKDLWVSARRDGFPRPIKMPIDTRFHCVHNDGE